MIQAVIFDLDGVIVSTDDLHYKAWQLLAQKLGISSFTRQDNMRQRGVSRMESLDILLEKADNAYTQDEKVKLADWKNERYVEMLSNLSASDILPGVRETLVRLRAQNVLTAIGSSSKNTNLILRQIGLDSAFDAVCGGQDITKSKPDPEIFLLAAKRLGVAPAACLVVEDAAAGIAAGTAAGMATLAVGAAFGNPGATFHAQNLQDAASVWDQVL
jgi:beta-phosphoglucomutase